MADKKIEERIAILEEMVAKLWKEKVSKEQSNRNYIEFENLRDEACAQIGHDM